MSILYKLKTYFYLIFWLLLVVGFIVAGSLQIEEYNKLAKEKSLIISEISKQEEISENLKRDKSYYESDEFIEKTAREKLGYIKQDEIVFIEKNED